MTTKRGIVGGQTLLVICLCIAAAAQASVARADVAPVVAEPGEARPNAQQVAAFITGLSTGNPSLGVVSMQIIWGGTQRGEKVSREFSTVQAPSDKAPKAPVGKIK